MKNMFVIKVFVMFNNSCIGYLILAIVNRISMRVKFALNVLYLEILDHILNYLEKSKVFIDASNRVHGHGWMFPNETC